MGLARRNAERRSSRLMCQQGVARRGLDRGLRRERERERDKRKGEKWKWAVVRGKRVKDETLVTLGFQN